MKKQNEILWTDSQKKMITDNGDVKRYINSNKIDKFEPNQCADISFPNGYNKACRVHNECPTINTTTTRDNFIVKTNKLRIRKLTPKECIRLMGFQDKDYEAMKEIGMTDSAIYHMAGDSIVVTVLISIFTPLITNNHKLTNVENYIETIIER